jgi:hypothetical protein
MIYTYITLSAIRGWAFFLLVAAAGCFTAEAMTPQEIWPQEAPAPEAGKLEARLAALDKASGSLPQTLLPALRFQKIFLQMISSAPPSAWRADIEKLSQAQGGDPIAQNVGEAARLWLARVEMQDLDRVLRGYYRKHVSFPDTLGRLGDDIPKNLRTDPWGKPWAYSPQAPRGFNRLAGQRYRLGPERFPQLSTFKEATGKRPPVSCSWKVVLRDMDGVKALEFRSLTVTTSVGMMQPGGRFEECVLMHIGEQWALMAARDQLFAIAFEK